MVFSVLLYVSNLFVLYSKLLPLFFSGFLGQYRLLFPAEACPLNLVLIQILFFPPPLKKHCSPKGLILTLRTILQILWPKSWWRSTFPSAGQRSLYQQILLRVLPFLFPRLLLSSGR